MCNDPVDIQPYEEMQSRAFSDSYAQIIGWIRSRLIAEKNINHQLSIAQFYGDIRWANFDGIYHDNDIEDIVELRVLQSKRLKLPHFSIKEARTVLIASDLYAVGGHSRVVLNWMKAFEEEGGHELLITRRATTTIRASLRDQNIPYHLCSNEGIDLVNEILAYCANMERIVLHTHPDDIITAIAARILTKSGKQIIFYNHADHVFSYGISSAQLVCEVSSYGIELNRRTQRIKQSCYLGIPISCRGYKSHLEIQTEKKINQTVISCGEPYKYAPGGFFFGDFIDALLEQRNDVTVQLVGPTGNEPWWATIRGRWGAQVQFLGKLSHSKYLDTMQKADVYVDSFPITGGTAFPEALLNGKLVAGLVNPIQGYSPVDELRVGDVRSLAEQVIALLKHDPISIRRIEEVRAKANAIHSITNFRERVKKAYAGIYDTDAKIHVRVDTYWFENEWRSGRRTMSVYRSYLWFRMYWGFCIPYTQMMYKSGKVKGYEMALDTAKGLICRLLPSAIRKSLISWLRV
jgi:glycosyltransferase involved in cell wall biosynthesis